MQGMRRWMVQGIVVMCLIGFLAGCSDGDGDDQETTQAPTTTTAPSAGQFRSLVIESAEIFTDTFFRSCVLRVKLRNTASQTNGFQLLYTAFNTAGNGIGQTLIGGVLPANSTTVTIEQVWLVPTGGGLACSQIASFRLDVNSSVAL